MLSRSRLRHHPDSLLFSTIAAVCEQGKLSCLVINDLDAGIGRFGMLSPPPHPVSPLRVEVIHTPSADGRLSSQ